MDKHLHIRTWKRRHTVEEHEEW